MGVSDYKENNMTIEIEIWGLLHDFGVKINKNPTEWTKFLEILLLTLTQKEKKNLYYFSSYFLTNSCFYLLYTSIGLNLNI